MLSAIPTQYMRPSWKRLAPYLSAGVPIVSVAKGVENDTLLRPTEVIADVLRGERGRIEDRVSRMEDSAGRSSPSSILHPPSSTSATGNALAALSGPNIAAEISKYLPATAVAAAEDEGLALRVQLVFSTQWFRVYTNTDVTGVELAGATKNVIAIAAGILDGLAAGNNAKAALVTRGMVEITRLGVAMGAAEETFHGLAGVGDLITTCVSPEGRNRTVGERIGKGQKLEDVLGKMDSVAEGVPTTRSVMQLARRHGVEMPITEAVHAVLFEGKDAIHALTDLMARDPKPEAEQGG